MRVSRRFFLRKMVGYMSTRAVTRLSTQTNCRERRSHLCQPIPHLLSSTLCTPTGQVQSRPEGTVAPRLYLAVQSQQHHHQEEEAGPERGEGQHDHSPRIGDECQARPCGEKGFRAGSNTARLVQAHTATSHAGNAGSSRHRGGPEGRKGTEAQQATATSLLRGLGGHQDGDVQCNTTQPGASTWPRGQPAAPP